jgi:glycosyltransferase involved in cell wall biosynthesis
MDRRLIDEAAVMRAAAATWPVPSEPERVEGPDRTAAGSLSGFRIAQLIESDGPGGAERVVADLAAAFQAAGATSVVFLPEDGDGWLARQLQGTGVTIDHFHIERPLSPACARSLAAAFRRHRIDLAHSHEFSMAVYGAWASWLAGVQHVITMHGSRYYAAHLRRRVAMRAAIAFSGQTIAVSNPLADHLSRDLRVRRSRIPTIVNGVRPPQRLAPTLRQELGLQPTDRLIVSVGNLYPVKGHQHLLDALARLTARHPTAHVAIGGRGDLEHALRCRARELGVANRVHLLGLRSDVSAVLKAADVFVLPSLSEGLPLALLEAMFAGCPIVATNVGDVSIALAQGDAGTLVEPGDPRALARAIDELLSDPQRASAVGGRAARRAAAEYDVSRMVQHYSTVYEGLLARRPAPRTQFLPGHASSNG